MIQIKNDVRVYGVWAGNPNGTPENPNNCIEEVGISFGRSTQFSQCSHKRGKGLDGLYCGIHAKRYPAKDERREEIISYYAKMEYGHPRLAKVQILPQGPKTFKVEVLDNILGENDMMKYDRFAKPSKYFFDSLGEAVDFLGSEISNEIKNLKDKIEYLDGTLEFIATSVIGG